MRRALAFCDRDSITPDDLPATIAIKSIHDENFPHLSSNSLKAYECFAIKNALLKSGGNKRHAAVLLEISEATLYRRIKEFGLSN
jgi:DNA-binding NtrC family response regulator